MGGKRIDFKRKSACWSSMWVFLGISASFNFSPNNFLRAVFSMSKFKSASNVIHTFSTWHKKRISNLWVFLDIRTASSYDSYGVSSPGWFGLMLPGQGCRTSRLLLFDAESLGVFRAGKIGGNWEVREELRFRCGCCGWMADLKWFI